MNKLSVVILIFILFCSCSNTTKNDIVFYTFNETPDALLLNILIDSKKIDNFNPEYIKQSLNTFFYFTAFVEIQNGNEKKLLTRQYFYDRLNECYFIIDSGKRYIYDTFDFFIQDFFSFKNIVIDKKINKNIFFSYQLDIDNTPLNLFFHQNSISVRKVRLEI